MMLNMRGLVFNDPLGSQGLHFSKVVFRNTDSDIAAGSRSAGTEWCQPSV